MKSANLCLVVFASVASVNAQIQIVNIATSTNQVAFTENYRQGFDVPVVSFPGSPWINNITLPGWYSALPVLSEYGGGLLSLGPAGGMGDRALGAAGSVGSKISFALRLENSTTSPIAGVSVEFDGEQWNRWSQANGPQVSSLLSFSYKIFERNQGGVFLDDDNTTWTYVPELNFVSPNATINTTQVLLDGNAPENSVRDIQWLVTGFTLAPGQELWLRWGSQNVPAGVASHGIGIDNLSVSFITAIPEPAAFAGIAGLGALGLALSRRRNRLG